MSEEQRPSEGGEPGARGPDGREPAGHEGMPGAGGPGRRAREGEGHEPGARGAGWARWGDPEVTAPGTEGERPARVTRSRQPKIVGGVCAGLGRYFDLDPVIFRVPLAVLSVVGGLGLVFYGFAWLFIPAEGETENEARRLLSGRVEAGALLAVLIALVGCGLFLASLNERSMPFSLLLVGAVLGAAYWSRHRRQAEAAEAVGAPLDPTTAHAVADAPPEAQAPPVPGTPSWWREPLTKDGAGGTGYLWGPEDSAAETAAPPPATGGPPVAARRQERRRRRSLGGLVSLLASVTAAAVIAGGWDSRPLGTGLMLGLACALAVFGLGMVISAFVGRTGPGTVFLAVVTAVLLAVSALVPKDIGTEWHAVTWTPAGASQVRPEYRLDSGAGELDLRKVSFPKQGGTVRTHARVGAGQLRVIVPQDVRLKVDASVDAGELRLPVRTDADGQVVFRSVSGLDRHARTTLEPFGGAKPRGTLELTLDVGVGQTEVVRQLSSGALSDQQPVRGEAR